LKETSNAFEQLEKLKDLELLLNIEGQEVIRQDIKYLEYGIAGENNIAFELKNSHMPMYIIHDIYLEHEGLTAQIDYLVFTKKICFIIECKNLVGNIEINNSGDFIRTIEFGGKKKKEGIYSPLTQNQRHLELMKKIKSDSKSNIISRLIVDKFFEESYKSLVVLANPKTMLNAKFAKKEIKEKVIRSDQLISTIKEIYEKCKDSPLSEDKMREWAQRYLYLNREIEKDYLKKYDKFKKSNPIDKEIEKEDINIPIEETEIFKDLKGYRLIKSREEKIKPYYIFNDNQLKDLIQKNPKTKEMLLEVSGFSESKVNKYGIEILEILRKHKVEELV